MNDIDFELRVRLNNNVLRQKEIEKSIEFLPKGHINTLYRNNRGYYYLTYREGNKIKNEYLGPEGKTDLNNIMNKLHNRKVIEEELVGLKKEARKIKKLINVLK